MKIGLINTYSYNNVGDAAIYAALSKMLTGDQISTSLKKADGSAIEGMDYAADMSEMDVYVSVGGDIFNNARPKLITRTFLQNLKQLNLSPKTTMLFGQSIPASCQGISLKLLVSQLKRIASVTVRDQQSYTILQKQGVNCRLSYDTAFVLSPSPAAVNYANNVLASLSNMHSAVISLREFNALYPVDNENFVHNIASLCQQLLQSQYQPILLIQSSVSDMDSDWVIAKAILALCPQVKVIDLVNYVAEFPSWELLQAILKTAQLIVAVRYHTAVLALAAGRVPYNLYYSNKGADLCERLNIPGSHVSQFNPKQAFDLILSTRTKAFNAANLRQQVYSDFNSALAICRNNYNSVPLIFSNT